MSDKHRSQGAGYLDAAEKVLRSARKPLRCRDIVQRASDAGLLHATGETPEKTLHAMLIRHILRLGNSGTFKKVSKGLFDLR